MLQRVSEHLGTFSRQLFIATLLSKAIAANSRRRIYLPNNLQFMVVKAYVSKYRTRMYTELMQGFQKWHNHLKLSRLPPNIIRHKDKLQKLSCPIVYKHE